MFVLSHRWNSGGAQKRPFAGRPERRFLELGEALQIFGPAWIGRQGLAFLPNELPEFLDSQILNQKLDPRPAAILLFAMPGENARDGLRRAAAVLRAG